MEIDRLDPFWGIGAAPGELAVVGPTLAIDDVDRVVGQRGDVIVFQIKLSDPAELCVRHEREGEPARRRPLRGDLRGVHADRHDFNAALSKVLEPVLQLTELRVAGGSPIAPVDDDQHIAAGAGVGRR